MKRGKQDKKSVKLFLNSDSLSSFPYWAAGILSQNGWPIFVHRKGYSHSLFQANLGIYLACSCLTGSLSLHPLAVLSCLHGVGMELSSECWSLELHLSQTCSMDVCWSHLWCCLIQSAVWGGCFAGRKRCLFLCFTFQQHKKAKMQPKAQDITRLGNARCAVGHWGGAFLTDLSVLLKSSMKEFNAQRKLRAESCCQSFHLRVAVNFVAGGVGRGSG